MLNQLICRTLIFFFFGSQSSEFELDGTNGVGYEGNGYCNRFGAKKIGETTGFYCDLESFSAIDLAGASAVTVAVTANFATEGAHTSTNACTATATATTTAASEKATTATATAVARPTKAAVFGSSTNIVGGQARVPKTTTTV